MFFYTRGSLTSPNAIRAEAVRDKRRSTAMRNRRRAAMRDQWRAAMRDRRHAVVRDWQCPSMLFFTVIPWSCQGNQRACDDGRH